MPRYLVERSFPEELEIPVNGQGVQVCQAVISKNTENEVTWLHSYVSADKRKSFCICDARSPEAVRLAARRNGLPVDRITEVRVLDPYFYN